MTMPDIQPNWVWYLVAFYIYSAAVQTMPRPLPDERWYSWVYGFLQVIGANLKDAMAKRDVLTTTTTTSGGGEPTTKVVVEAKVTEADKTK